MQAFFFDLDGTLIESKGIISELINETLMEFGYAPFTEEEMLASIGIPLEGLFSLKADKEIVPKMCQRYVDKYLKKGLQKTKLYDGVVELLRELKDDKTRIGIVTTKSEEEAKQVIEHFGFSPYVDIIVGHTGKRETKPKPDPILHACSRLSVTPDRTVMVGDTQVDIRAGKRAGTFATIGVLWGVGTEKDLQEADYVAHTLGELEYYVKKIKDQLSG